jgi:hypothetical protein
VNAVPAAARETMDVKARAANDAPVRDFDGADTGSDTSLAILEPPDV